MQLGEEPEHGHADEDTGKGAEHPLHQTTAGGAVTRLADEQYGEQDPVPLVQVKRLQNAIAHHQPEGEPQGMAKHHGVGVRCCLSNASKGRATGRAREAGWWAARRGLQLFGALQQLVDAGQVATQELHRCQQGLGVVLLEVGELQLIAEGLRVQ